MMVYALQLRSIERLSSHRMMCRLDALSEGRSDRLEVRIQYDYLSQLLSIEGNFILACGTYILISNRDKTRVWAVHEGRIHVLSGSGVRFVHARVSPHSQSYIRPFYLLFLAVSQYLNKPLSCPFTWNHRPTNRLPWGYRE